MRLLYLFLLAMLMGGCDQLGLGDGEAPVLMNELDGTWTLAVTNELIESDGSVRAVPPLSTDPLSDPPPNVLIGRRVDCGPVSENVADSDRLMKLTEDSGSGRCEVLTADGEALRIVFVSAGPVFTDVVGTIRERGNRHVWDFYRPLSDGTTRRYRWTLTPRT